MGITYIAGTIAPYEIRGFNKMIFRASRGKVMSFMQDEPIEIEEADGTKSQKLVYLLIFQVGGTIKDRVMRMCNSFSGKVYPLPGDGNASQGAFLKEIAEYKNIINQSLSSIAAVRKTFREYLKDLQDMRLDNVKGVSLFCFYQVFVRKE
jgi:hypothetical protein